MNNKSMFVNLLNIALGRYENTCNCPCCQEEQSQQEEANSDVDEDVPVVIPGMVRKITTPPSEPTLTDLIDTYDDPDIEALVGRYGDLYEGMVIEIELSDACELLDRSRKRVDAFKGIISKLRRDYGVELIVKSRKSK